MAKTRIGANAIFSGPQLGLSIIGSHCYAFSGDVVASTSQQTVLNFATGTGYIVATLTMTAPIKYTSGSITNGQTRGYQLDFNNQTVGMFKLESQQENMPTMVEAQILIPPFTAVVLTCIDNNSDALYSGTANITGRVHNA